VLPYKSKLAVFTS